MQQKEIKYENKKLVYRTSGQGPAVVLVHGFGEDGSVWNQQLEALQGYHLIIPDLPGSGASEIIADMNIEGMASALERLIVHETATVFYKKGEPGSVIMIGHSMGGYVTLAFAEMHPDMLRGFGLFHSTAYADSEEKKETRRKGIEFIRSHGGMKFLKTMIPNLYGPITKEKFPEKIQAHIDSAKNFSDEALSKYYEAMIRRPDRTHILQQTTLPVLFVMGRFDAAVPVDEGLKQCHQPKQAHIHILEESGHMGMKEEVLKTNQILQNYLQYCNS